MRNDGGRLQVFKSLTNPKTTTPPHPGVSRLPTIRNGAVDHHDDHQSSIRKCCWVSMLVNGANNDWDKVKEKMGRKIEVGRRLRNM